MRKTKNSYIDSSISTLPKKISQKLIDVYRLKLFAKIKDSLDKDRTTPVNKDELEFKKWLEDKNFINQPINNSWFSPYIRA
ncbi:hypothetical protein N5T67_09210 [Aliarcobacter butzleri]|jgi:hypothetical protein|uniref:hypothetical protein n=1 Tax=Aliarcobacter butzleri TaxID=28197 RepID=UPI00125F4253|nr:hypothetical protein [Aliarcobacter butzleri]MCT7553015.1 hypothetical protein [Aliarcobacter butzleri]MCT7553708.1 hypothetical protein [Aliarcobacter butzleri]MCT7557526.1 hypothetical protein [Aliarcobacter butzleri]MCT7563378.1 hypothetical protein [Aliarcobacter butzleri]MCT7635929.1 hypothetical protein [Aliarcobacter butzleri]